MMKRIANILCVFFVSTCLLAHSEGQDSVKKKQEIIDKVDGMYQEIAIYIKAGKNPMALGLPLSQRMVTWSDETENLSEEEKQELARDTLQMRDAAIDKMFASWSITKSSAIDGSRAFEAIFCPIVGNQSYECKDLQKRNRERCNKIWSGCLMPTIED